MPECRSSADHSFDFGSIVLPVGQQFQLQNNADAAYVLYVLILYNGSRGLWLAGLMNPSLNRTPSSFPESGFTSRCDVILDAM